MAAAVPQWFLEEETDFPCPVCGYAVWVLLAEIVAQTAVLCPCCRTRIWLRDDAGSMQAAGRAIEEQIGELIRRLAR